MAMFLGRKSRVESAAYLPQQVARLGRDFGLQGPVHITLFPHSH